MVSVRALALSFTKTPRGLNLTHVTSYMASLYVPHFNGARNSDEHTRLLLGIEDWPCHLFRGCRFPVARLPAHGRCDTGAATGVIEKYELLDRAGGQASRLGSRGPRLDNAEHRFLVVRIVVGSRSVSRVSLWASSH